MSDIVERLRNVRKGLGFIETDDDLGFVSLDAFLQEAADTIERCYGAIADLQAEVRKKSDEIEQLRYDNERFIHLLNFSQIAIDAAEEFLDQAPRVFGGDAKSSA